MTQSDSDDALPTDDEIGQLNCVCQGNCGVTRVVGGRTYKEAIAHMKSQSCQVDEEFGTDTYCPECKARKDKDKKQT